MSDIAHQKVKAHFDQSFISFSLYIGLFLGEVLAGRISCRKDPKDCRALIVTFNIDGETLKYYVR